MAPREDLELRIAHDRDRPPADLWSAVRVLITPDHEHGRGHVAQLVVGEEVLGTGSSEAHGQPHVAQHRGAEARLAHALVHGLEEAVGRERCGARSEGARGHRAACHRDAGRAHPRDRVS